MKGVLFETFIEFLQTKAVKRKRRLDKPNKKIKYKVLGRYVIVFKRKVVLTG